MKRIYNTENEPGRHRNDKRICNRNKKPNELD